MRPILVSACLLAAGLAAAAEIPADSLEGDAETRARLEGVAAPEGGLQLELADVIEADDVDLSDLSGKIVVLDFWATWCGPCIASIPHNNELAERYADQVVIVGVCHPQGAERMASVAEEHGIAYPVGVDTDQKLIEHYQVNGYPDYYVFDRQGRLIGADVANRKVDEVLELLTAEATAE